MDAATDDPLSLWEIGLLAAQVVLLPASIWLGLRLLRRIREATQVTLYVTLLGIGTVPVLPAALAVYLLALLTGMMPAPQSGEPPGSAAFWLLSGAEVVGFGIIAAKSIVFFGYFLHRFRTRRELRRHGT